MVIDDDRGMCELLEIGLHKRGFEVIWRTQPLAALHVLLEDRIDAVVIDLNMPGLKGTELCQRVLASRPELPIILITAFGTMEMASAAMRAGACDFLTKPFEVDALALALTRAVQHRSLREEVKVLRQSVAARKDSGAELGVSPVMQQVYALAACVAHTDGPVLITGETGVGKETIARVIHEKSARRSNPFVVLRCAELPQALLESELFGQLQGSRPDVSAARAGLLRQAAGGTLLIDDIGELPLAMQPKLLRVIQERPMRPGASDSEPAVDVRILATTHSDLEAAIAEHRFLADLFFRISVVQVNLPPLRSRGADVLLIAQHVLEQCAARLDKTVASLSPRAAECLLTYPWPGNICELQRCIERAVALSPGSEVELEHLPETIRQHRQASPEPGRPEGLALMPLDEVERRYILHVLDVLAGNKALAAQILGLDRHTLHRKLDRYAQRV